MKSTDFFLSTDISIGLGVFEKASEFIKKIGVRRPGILYDSNLGKSDYFNDNFKKIVENFPNCFFLVNEMNSEPTYRYLEEINNNFKKKNPDVIIAIGGGSTMDLGKGISLLLKNDVPALSLKGFPENVNNPVPLVTIPSIFGSGSEVSYNAVFIDEDEGRKLGINSKNNFPIKTLIDPLLTMSAPNSAVISSALDTLVHCVDSFGSKKSSSFSKMFSIEGFTRTFNTLLNNDLSNPKSRTNLAIGSICGITALMNSGDGPTNGFAYYFGVKDKIAHGLAGGIFLKEVMKWNYKKGYNEYYQLLDGNRCLSDGEKNSKLFNDFDKLYGKYKIPTLRKLGYKNEGVKTLAQNVSKSLEGSFLGNPISFNVKSAEEVLTKLIDKEY